ncbi:MAG: FAD-dependent oxidoreductase [Pseudomonadota bacterium]|nr:MAG: FAD-dependent oxidoreductase [Pseudomonadota bacterium]
MDDKVSGTHDAVVLGAGLAGLAAERRLADAGRFVTVVERGAVAGGLARTVTVRGFRFDLGGHRFITDDPAIEAFVRDLLGSDCLSVPRSSRIMLGGKCFHYPLRPLNAILGFGALTSARILFDYACEQLRARWRSTTPRSLEDWVVRNFGRRLFEIYFRDYSEKVWGIDSRHIAMQWVAQRVQGLSLGRAIRHAMLPAPWPRLHTLADRFLYPAQGIGQIAQRLVGSMGSRARLLNDTSVVRIEHRDNHITGAVVRRAGYEQRLVGEHFISSIPLQALIATLSPPAPAPVRAAAAGLRSRDLVLVTLMLDRARATGHTWIYFPEPQVPFGRIHEPTNWSTQMAPSGKTALVAEHFCFRGDGTWGSSNEALVQRTRQWLARLGFIDPAEVIDAEVVRVPNAYPLFEVGYETRCQCICDYLARFDNLHLTGRGGKFRYYNMDQAIGSGMQAAQAVLDAPLPAYLHLDTVQTR